MATKTIGYNNSGTQGDYPSLATWWATECNGQTLSAPAIGQLMNGTNLGVAGTMTPFAPGTLFDTAGCTTSPTNFVRLEPAAGYGFGYNPSGGNGLIDPAVGPLRYDVAKGAAITTGTGYNYAIKISSDNITLLGLQIAGTTAGTSTINFNGKANTVVDRCLLRTQITGSNAIIGEIGAGCTVKSCLLVSAATATYGVNSTTGALSNCTIARLSTQTAAGIGINGATGLTAKNCATFGFTTATGGALNASSDYFATDQSSVGVIGGTHNLTSVAYTTATFAAIGATPDYRIVTGAALKDAGVTISGVTAGILSVSIPQGSAPDIGAFEFPQASGPVAGTTATSSVTTTTLTVSESGASGTGTLNYQFKRAPDVSGSPGSFSNIGTNSTATSFGDTSLSPSATYWYKCTVTDNVGSTDSTPVSVTTAAATATSYTLIGPSSGTVGVASTNFTVTPVGGSYTGTITPHSTGTGTFSPTNLSFSGSGFQTFTYTPTTTAGSPHTISTTASPALGTDPSGIAYTVNPAPFAGGTLALTPHKTSIGYSITAPSGGTGPYAYLLEHASTFGGTYATAASGAISGTVTGTHSGLTYRTPHAYRVTFTDSASGSIVVHASSGTLPPRSVGLIQIGDSITQGMLSSVAVRATDTLFAANIKDSNASDFAAMPQYNCGISGTSTLDWLAARAAFTFSDLSSNDTTAVPIDWMVGKVASLGAVDLVLVTVMLGTNDSVLSSGNDAPSAFKTRMTSFLGSLATKMAASYPGQAYKVLLHYPPCPACFAASPARTEAQAGTIQAYQAQIDSLVDNVTVFQGDRDVFNLTAANPALISGDTLHPNATGYAAAIKLQCDAITSFLVNEGYPPPSGAAVPVTYKSGQRRRGR